MRKYISIPYGKPQNPPSFLYEISEICKRLEKNQELQKDVKNLRLKWSIPINGFKNDNEWGEWVYPLVDNTPEYILRNYKDGKNIKFVTSAQGLRHIVDISGPWRSDLENLVDMYVDRSFTQLIQWYVFQNIWRKDFFPQRNFDMFFYPDLYEAKEDNSPKRLFIEIYPSTTQEDIIKNWKDVKTKQKELSKLPQRFIRSRPNNQIDSDILYLQKIGVKSKIIADRINEKYGISYSDSEVRAMALRAKKRLRLVTDKS